MNTAQNWGWFSPLCLWVEKRMGDERQRTLTKRLALVLLTSAALILAYDSATLPVRIAPIWSRNLTAEITHVSSVVYEGLGEGIAVALSADAYHSGMDRIVLLNARGEEVGNMCDQIPIEVAELLYLPSKDMPGMVIALPPRYGSGSSYIVKPSTTKLEVATDLTGSEESFSPTRLEFIALPDGKCFIIGFSPEGRSYLSGHIYTEDTGLRTVWVKDLRCSQVFAKIMISDTGEPHILARESHDVLALYEINGSRLCTLNLTEFLLSKGMFGINTSVHSSVWMDQTVFGSGRVGVCVTSSEKSPDRGWGPARQSVLVLDSELRVVDFWEKVPYSFLRPVFISSESKILTGDICLKIGGDIAWIRRGSWERLVDDIDGDGSDEAVALGPAWVGRHTGVQILGSRGRLVAKGTVPGLSGNVAATDLDSDGRKEILYYSGTQLLLLGIGQAPYLPRLAVQIGLLLLAVGLVLVVVRRSWPPECLGRLRRFVASRAGAGSSHRVRDKPARYARLRTHEEYRVCDCGARNPVSAGSCSICGKEFRQRRTAGVDLSAAGWLSRTGLAMGVFGLVIYLATPAVWSVERFGVLFRLTRAFFSMVSPTVPYYTWMLVVPSLLALAGVCLIYLERSALMGALFCLSGLGVVVYLAVCRATFVRFPFILVGLCGFLQFGQKIVTRRRRAVHWAGGT